MCSGYKANAQGGAARTRDEIFSPTFPQQHSLPALSLFWTLVPGAFEEQALKIKNSRSSKGEEPPPPRVTQSPVSKSSSNLSIKSGKSSGSNRIAGSRSGGRKRFQTK